MNVLILYVDYFDVGSLDIVPLDVSSSTNSLVLLIGSEEDCILRCAQHVC